MKEYEFLIVNRNNNTWAVDRKLLVECLQRSVDDLFVVNILRQLDERGLAFFPQDSVSLDNWNQDAEVYIHFPLYIRLTELHPFVEDSIQRKIVRWTENRIVDWSRYV